MQDGIYNCGDTKGARATRKTREKVMVTPSPNELGLNYDSCRTELDDDAVMALFEESKERMRKLKDGFRITCEEFMVASGELMNAMDDHVEEVKTTFKNASSKVFDVWGRLKEEEEMMKKKRKRYLDLKGGDRNAKRGRH